MKTLLNIIWFIFSGFWLFIGYGLAGLLACITIIGIPVGVASFRIAAYVVWPFGRAIITKPGGDSAGILIANIIWIVLFGWGIALGHLISAATLAITIIGIPLALGNLKMIPVAFVPFGKAIVPSNAIPVGYNAVVQL
ncbi:MAG: YccF domain-containing protein [Corynebacterium sp.]|nr:YccF domain-containing protein [Corynebacterium sp.]